MHEQELVTVVAQLPHDESYYVVKNINEGIVYFETSVPINLLNVLTNDNK